MAEEVEYLKSKFINGLGFGTDEGYYNSKLRCKDLFKEVMDLIEKKPIPPLSNGDDQLKALRDFRDQLHELDMLLGDCQKLSKDRSLFNRPRNHILIGEIKTKLTKIKADLKVEQGSSCPQAADVSTQRSNVKVIDHFRWSNRSMESELIGFKEEVMAVEKMIFGEDNKDKFKGIGIVGKKGIGKTALAQVIFNKKRVKEHFLPRIWVPMSKQEIDEENSKKEIVKRMLDCLGVEDEVIEVAERKDLSGLLFALQLQLWGKRYLIVLDDVWNKEDPWYYNLGGKLTEISQLADQLAYGFPKGRGGTVIVTGRDDDVVTKMVPKENVYTVLPLSDPENVWAVFMESLKRAWVLKSKIEDREFSDKEEEMILESEILQRPNPDEFKGTGIFGESYKVAVVRNVYNKMKGEGFNPAIWVSLSKQGDETEMTDKQIVKKMLVELQVDGKVIEEALGTGEKSGLLSALQLRLQGKKYLIVLDDVWSKVQVTIKEREFGSWLEEICKWGEGYGGRLIVTSMEEEFAAEMVGKGNIYKHPHTFSKKEHAWWIFINASTKKRSDGVEENRRNDLEFLKDDVVKKSQGFPLAAKLMGQLMYDQLQIADKPPVQADVNLADDATADTGVVTIAQPADDTRGINATVPTQAEDPHTDNGTVSPQADDSITSGAVSASATDVSPQADNSITNGTVSASAADDSITNRIVSASAADDSITNRIVSASPADDTHTNNGTISLQADGSLTNGIHTAVTAAPADTNNGIASPSADDSETNAVTARPTPPPADASHSNGTP